jgi:RND superfamily putative drug exporter
VAAFWLLVTVAGVANVSSATKALSDQNSVPGREGYETNAAITRAFGNGGHSAPLVALVSLPAGTSVRGPAVTNGLAAVATRIERAVPRVRVASYASTRDRAFVSADGSTTYVLAYAPPRRGNFGENPQAANAAQNALRGVTTLGSPVRLTGLDALSASTGQKGGVGLLVEGLLGGLGAGIILDATVVRALLVPAAVALFGRFNWWLPGPLARVLRVTAARRPVTDASCA